MSPGKKMPYGHFFTHKIQKLEAMTLNEFNITILLMLDQKFEKQYNG